MVDNGVNLPNVDKQPRVRRSAYIADHLRDMIFNGNLKPGDRLPTEEQLCKHFGVSRTTLRESVQMLRVSGLLDVTPGRGSFIKIPDPSILLKDLTLIGHYSSKSCDDALSMCAILQIEMVAKACDASSAGKRKLHNKVINCQDDAGIIEQLEHDWHMIIAKLAGNELAATMLNAILNICKSQRLEKFADSNEIARTMGVQIRLNSAIMDGDKETAMRIMSGYMGTELSSLALAA